MGGWGPGAGGWGVGDARVLSIHMTPRLRPYTALSLPGNLAQLCKVHLTGDHLLVTLAW